MTFEETTTAQWLYTELKDFVDKIVVCDPHRNRPLSEGAKTDKIDATKLVQLLKNDLIKEVFHSNDKYIELRKIIGAYEDVINAGVRLKNQRSALFRAVHKNHIFFRRVRSIKGGSIFGPIGGSVYKPICTGEGLTNN